MKYNKLYIFVMSIIVICLIVAVVNNTNKWDLFSIILISGICFLSILSIIVTYIISKN